MGVTANAPANFKLWYQTLSNQDPVVTASRQLTADRGVESADSSAVTANISGTACGAVSECWGWFTPPGIADHGGSGCSNVFFLIDTYTAPGVKASTMATWQRWCAINTYADWEGYVFGGLNTHNAGFTSINGFFHEKVHPYFCCGYPYAGYGRRSLHDYAQGTVELCIDPPILPPYCIRHSPKISSYLHGDGSVYYHMWAK